MSTAAPDVILAPGAGGGVMSIHGIRVVFTSHAVGRIAGRGLDVDRIASGMESDPRRLHAAHAVAVGQAARVAFGGADLIVQRDGASLVVVTAYPPNRKRPPRQYRTSDATGSDR